MLKLLRNELKESSDEEGSDSQNGSEDEELSDFKEENLDEELEMKDVTEELEKKQTKRPTMSAQELGRERIRLAKKQEAKKEELKSIVDKALPHVNERPRKAQYALKQRTLIFSTRGVNQRMRHLMQDLRDLIPHSKSEPKFEFEIFNTRKFELRNNNTLHFFFFFKKKKVKEIAGSNKRDMQ
ncbi:ribosome biogenesis protein [Reticulomyxa filosa]|uniref:Ribosome biogenesis protein n=1 Tax=Reticulomyxa filosa TaxID=46433 RepID=X6M6R4_RETFI|nr:ribosome biogenesis protein [Reticulomyxa filosa]|eukprot:ETO09683.1 ribosome biogenesis protein [Reticulomyxa filosa]